MTGILQGLAMLAGLAWLVKDEIAPKDRESALKAGSGSHTPPLQQAAGARALRLRRRALIGFLVSVGAILVMALVAPSLVPATIVAAELFGGGYLTLSAIAGWQIGTSRGKQRAHDPMP